MRRIFVTEFLRKGGTGGGVLVFSHNLTAIVRQEYSVVLARANAN